jgi:putative phosphoribosyl transferase
MLGADGFESREEAGALLARELASQRFERPVVLALPRGGVPVALACAQALGAPLDLLLVRKIGVPWHPELAAAALVDGAPPDLVLNQQVMAMAALTLPDLQATIAEEQAEIQRRRNAYLTGRPAIPVMGRSVIVVDDGIATGTTLKAAIKALRRRQAGEIVVAVPVAPADTLAELRGDVDRIHCLLQPEPFEAVGCHYVDFHQLSDDEVIRLMAQAPQDTEPAA